MSGNVALKQFACAGLAASRSNTTVLIATSGALDFMISKKLNTHVCQLNLMYTLESLLFTDATAIWCLVKRDSKCDAPANISRDIRRNLMAAEIFFLGPRSGRGGEPLSNT